MQPPAASSTRAVSLLTPIGYRCNDCGYCKQEDTSQRTPQSRASYYIRTRGLTPEHYQVLVDRGWRRSGSLLYLPDLLRSCCPHYTIRLPATEFRTTRDHRQAVNRWNRFVLGDRYIKDRDSKYPKSKEEKKQSQTSFDLVQAIHDAEIQHLKPGLVPEHQFEVTIEPAAFSEEKYLLFHDYQQQVHHEDDQDITRQGFRRFLCESPLETYIDDKGRHQGSLHQCYRLDGRLIAMSVLDLLPHTVSGVYFIYHHDFEKWSFGKLSALRETALALEMDYQYYYMGYYIHCCKKMRYKADYKPQYVLDLDSWEWDPLDDHMKALMEARRYVSMSRERARPAPRLHPVLPVDESRSQDSPRESTAPPTTNDDDDDVPFPIPVEAMESGQSLFDLRMPGILPLEQVHREMDLDRLKIYLGTRVGVHEAQGLYSWSPGSYTDVSTLKGTLAQMAAAIGPTVAKSALIDLTR